MEGGKGEEGEEGVGELMEVGDTGLLTAGREKVGDACEEEDLLLGTNMSLVGVLCN